MKEAGRLKRVDVENYLNSQLPGARRLSPRATFSGFETMLPKDRTSVHINVGAVSEHGNSDASIHCVFITTACRHYDTR
jgi:hypothetical protein